MGTIAQPDGGTLQFDAATAGPIYSGTTQSVAGSWYELTASTAFDAVAIMGDYYVADSGGGWVDLGIGASGSEEMFVENMRYDRFGSDYLHNQFRIPIQIPKGSRLSARHANHSGTANRLTYVRTRLIGGGLHTPAPFQLCELLGSVKPIPSTTIGVHGSYLQVNASLPESYGAIMMGIYDDAVGGFTSSTWFFNIALGAAASEFDIQEDYSQSIDSSTDNFIASHTPPLPIYLPKGERLSVSCSRSLTTATGVKISIWGFR